MCYRFFVGKYFLILILLLLFFLYHICIRLYFIKMWLLSNLNEYS